jgi:hypothetical protein
MSKLKPGDLVVGSEKNTRGHIPLRRNEYEIDAKTVRINRVPNSTPLLIIDYFNKDHPGLFNKWYVIHNNQTWWVFEEDIKKIE